MLKVLLASLLGALLCVTWGAVSWMVLEWHSSTVRKFGDEQAVAAVLKANADQNGVYVLPAGVASNQRAPRDENEAAALRKGAERAREAGPFAYAIVRPGSSSFSLLMNLGLATGRSFLGAFIIALMLSWTVRLDYIQRVFFCVLAGLFAGVAADLPMLIWFEAPLRYTLINIADHVCEWFIAGLAIAAFVQGREVWERAGMR
jgi:hypothetical protein